MTEKRVASTAPGKRAGSAAPAKGAPATAPAKRASVAKPAVKGLKPASGPVKHSTEGKRTDLGSTVAPPVGHGLPSKATQGPPHLQGKPGPRTGGRRARGRG